MNIRTRFFNFSAILLLLTGILETLPALAQINSVVSVSTPSRLTGHRNQSVPVEVTIQVRNGYHVNSDHPNDPYLIPLKLTWTQGPAQAGEVTYPKPQLEKLDFSQKPVAIFSGDFKTQTKFMVPANAPLGEGMLSGKLRYQACNNHECLAPRTIEVKVPIDIRN